MNKTILLFAALLIAGSASPVQAQARDCVQVSDRVVTTYPNCIETVLVGPAPLARFDWTPTVLIAAGRIADQWSTQRFLTNGSGCTEGNGQLGPRPSVTRLTLYNAGVTAGLSGLQYLIYRTTRELHPTAGRRLNLALGVFGAVNGARLAIQNGRTCPGVGR